MRILIIGREYSAKRFFDLFESNASNIVFITAKDKNNHIEFNDSDDIIDFARANEIDLVLITDENYINQGLEERLNAINITAFSPSVDAIAICSSKAFAKRFMYKNKIPTPRFGIFERTQAAFEYLKQARYPLAIKPESRSETDFPKFVETKNAAKKAIESFYINDNDKVIIEDYVEGKNISVWTISDGYSAKIIGTTAKYYDNVALFEPDFVTNEIKKKINDEIIIPTISSLTLLDNEYVGILGFDIMLTYENKPYLLGYNSFFDDINADFFIEGFDLDWTGVFESCLVGDVFLKYNFEPKTKNMLALRSKDEIDLIVANARCNLEKYARELDCDLTEYHEAQKIWKYYQ